MLIHTTTRDTLLKIGAACYFPGLLLVGANILLRYEMMNIVKSFLINYCRSELALVLICYHLRIQKRLFLVFPARGQNRATLLRNLATNFAKYTYVHLIVFGVSVGTNIS